MLKGELKLNSSTTNPTPTGAGHSYYNSHADNKQARTWNGSEWKNWGETGLGGMEGLRLYWDFDNTDCYDSSSGQPPNVGYPSWAPQLTPHSSFRKVMNLSTVSPQNTFLNGGWICDSRAMIKDEDCANWSGDDSNTKDRVVYRSPQSVGFDSNSGSPFDVSTNGDTKTGGSAMMPANGHIYGNPTSIWYFNNSGTDQDDNLTIGTYVFFMRFHKRLPSNTNQFYQLLPYHYAGGGGVDGSSTSYNFTWFGIMCSSGTVDGTANMLANAYPASNYKDGGYDLAGRAWQASSTAGDYYNFNSVTDWNNKFNMYTIANRGGSGGTGNVPRTEHCYIKVNKNNTKVAGAGSDWYHSGYPTSEYYGARSGGIYNSGSWPYAWPSNWMNFGTGYVSAKSSITSQSCLSWGASDVQLPFLADIAVVMYFNKELSDAERLKIYDHYKGEFGLPN